MNVGFGIEVITPELPVKLSGYGDREGEATEVHDDLEVRVLVVTDGVTLCLLSFDLMAMSADWADPVRDAVAAALGTDRSAVLTSTIHTHSAPSTLTGSDFLGWTVPVAWREPLVDACVRAARQAAAAAEPAHLAFARVPLPAHLSFNRRGHEYAPTFAVLDVTRPDGTRVGTVVNIGVHPVVLGPRNLAVSADWVAVLRREVEARAGGTALFLQGCEGDVDPEGRKWDGSPDEWFAAVERVGLAMAGAALDARALVTPVEGPVGVASHRHVEVPVGGSPLAALSGAPDPLLVELVEWDLGGVRLVNVPGEGAAGFAAQVLAQRSEPLLFAGLCPHWNGYLPVPFEDGYEESLSYGAPAVARLLAEIGYAAR